MIGLTPQQDKCLRYLKQRTAKGRIAPTLGEIADAIGCKHRARVHYLLWNLERRGAIRCMRNDQGHLLPRAIEVVAS